MILTCDSLVISVIYTLIHVFVTSYTTVSSQSVSVLALARMHPVMHLKVGFPPYAFSMAFLNPLCESGMENLQGECRQRSLISMSLLNQRIGILSTLELSFWVVVVGI